MPKAVTIVPKPPRLDKKKRVAAYARVSSGKDAMLHSLSAQVSYYSDLIQNHGEWLYVGVYADEAKTGTKDSREDFQRIIADCRAGKIDMVITKSISRFARNTVTLLQTVREFKAMEVDIYFEEQNIHTMSGDGELMMTILASYAQEESRSASENQKWRIKRNFEDLDYNIDANYLLISNLKPLDNESYLVPIKRFYGREWLFAAFDRWLTEFNESRVFAIIGQAGSGKTAFVSQLCNKSKNIAAIHFCRYNNDERANPKRAIMSLAYHLSTQIDEYKQQLLLLSDLDKLLDKSTSRLFEYIFIEPLMKMQAPSEAVVIVIDALDEATKNMKNELINLIVSDFHKTPQWLRLVITSRPEQDITRRLNHLNPVVIVNDSKENMEDVRGYLHINLQMFLSNYSPKKQREIVDKVLAKSEGNFLYAVEIVKAVEGGILDLSEVDSFPVGLTNIYINYFERMFIKDPTYNYPKDIRPLMEILSVCYEPQNDDTIIDILNMDEYDFDDIKNHIFVLFPSTQGYIEPLHKSLIDWIVNKTLSGRFCVNEKAAHTRMSEYYGKFFSSSINNEYVSKYLAKHLLRSKTPEKAVEVLNSLDLQLSRIRIIGQDTAIREYLAEIKTLKEICPELTPDVLRSETFQYIFVKNRRYFYNAGLYFELKDIGLEDVISEYIQIDSLEILAGCVYYYYINEQYEDSEKLALDIIRRYYKPENYAIITELENEVALSCRKLVRFDDALQHCKIICETTGSSCPDFYEIALAHQTIGKVYYHRCHWEKAYEELCLAVRYLEDSLKLATDIDYQKMLKLYVAAFEREVALSLVWQKKTELAKQHLDHAKLIYDEVKTTDRYYIRYLYVNMFADAVNGDYSRVVEIYPDLLKIAKSNYDKSQIEFYYAIAMYWRGNVDESAKHLEIAKQFSDKIDAFLEKSEIAMFDTLLTSTNNAVKTNTIISDNQDIVNWLKFVWRFIFGEEK